MLVLNNEQIKKLLSERCLILQRSCDQANEAFTDFIVDCGNGQFGDEEGDLIFKSPFGKTGDQLPVYENFRVASWREDGRMAFDYQASPELIETPWTYPPAEDFEKFSKQAFQDCAASGLPEIDGQYQWEKGNSPCQWQQGEKMPEYLSRIKVKITTQEVVNESTDTDINMLWKLKIDLI